MFDQEDDNLDYAEYEMFDDQDQYTVMMVCVFRIILFYQIFDNFKHKMFDDQDQYTVMMVCYFN